jgi:hypothetical protein
VIAGGPRLTGMRERAGHLRRQRRCRPGPDAGWQVYARFPLTVTGLTAPVLSGDRGCPPRAEGLPAGPPGPEGDCRVCKGRRPDGCAQRAAGGTRTRGRFRARR